MKIVTVSIAVLVLGAALAPSVSSARASGQAHAPHVTGMVVRDSARRVAAPKRDARDASRPQRAERGARAATATRSSADRKLLVRLLAQARATDAREKAEAGARAERIYRTSQVSAPIIADTRACKRIGADGRSVYENCALAAANVQAR